jgi:hypothetical protein
MNEQDMAALKLKLEKLSSRKGWADEEDFNPMEMSGGNFDDAYSGGFSDGEASLAAEILLILNK